MNSPWPMPWQRVHGDHQDAFGLYAGAGWRVQHLLSPRMSWILERRWLYCVQYSGCLQFAWKSVQRLCIGGNLIQASVAVWEIVGVSSAWRILTNQIFTTEIPRCSKTLYSIHQTLLPHLLKVWERDYPITTSDLHVWNGTLPVDLLYSADIKVLCFTYIWDIVPQIIQLQLTVAHLLSHGMDLWRATLTQQKKVQWCPTAVTQVLFQRERWCLCVL